MACSYVRSFSGSADGRNRQRLNQRAMSPRAYRIGDIPTWRANAVLKVLAEP
jgi:hypothetical protein